MFATTLVLVDEELEDYYLSSVVSGDSFVEEGRSQDSEEDSDEATAH